jgi:hypothetical protein
MKVRRFGEAGSLVIGISGSERQRNSSRLEHEFHLRGCKLKAIRLRINISAFASTRNSLAAVPIARHCEPKALSPAMNRQPSGVSVRWILLEEIGAKGVVIEPKHRTQHGQVAL